MKEKASEYNLITDKILTELPKTVHNHNKQINNRIIRNQ